jgi:hypothetical protein
MTILSRVNRINSELIAENARLRHEKKILIEDNMKWRSEVGKLSAELSRLKHRMAIIADAEEAAE